LFLFFTVAAQGEVVRGIHLNDDDPYVVKAADGTIYKVEWFAGDSTWSQGDNVILSNDVSFIIAMINRNSSRTCRRETIQADLTLSL
jgi:hypothetical protein